MLSSGCRLLGRELGAIIVVYRCPHMLLLYLQVLAVASIERPKYAYGVLEHDSLGITLAESLGFHAVGTYWFLFAALDPALSTSYEAWSTGEPSLQCSATYSNSRS
jgi:hypothetical protein